MKRVTGEPLRMRAAIAIAGLVGMLLFLLAGVARADSTVIALEGSDATAFHEIGTYTEQLFTYLQNGSSNPVLILGGVGLSGLSAGQAVYDTNADPYSLAGYNLANYSAVYIESVGGCCTQADTSISSADEAAIGAAEASSGLNVGIENYGGGPAWGAILPASVDALPASDFGGITDFGTAGGPVCTDGEVVNAFGLSKGFTQPPPLGCYEHQAYLTSAFTSLGFSSLINADPAFFDGAGSAFLGIGGAFTPPPTSAPEPSALLMLGLGLGVVAVLRKKRARGLAASV